MYSTFIYEVRPFDRETWTAVSDDEFMDMLYRTHNKLTPLIKEMLTGKEIHANGCVYRIRAITKED